MTRGRTLIGVIFVLAIGMTGYAWWFHYRQSARVVDNWGAGTARLIRKSPRVWLLRLARGRRNDVKPDVAKAGQDRDKEGGRRQLSIDDSDFRVVDRIDISRIPGLIHIRHFLAEDSYFDWQETRAECRSNWAFAFEFAGERESQVLAFDRRCNRVMLVSTQRVLKLGPVTHRLQEFVDGIEE